MSNLLIRDNLTYHQQWGDLNLEPAVNFSYRNVHDSVNYKTISGSGGISNFINPYQNISSSTSSIKYKLYLLSPSLSFYYEDVFNIQAGFVSILNAGKDFYSIYHLERLYPFLTTTVDAGKLIGFSNISLHIFGSFSRQTQLLDDDYSSLSGFSSANNMSNSNGFILGNTSSYANSYAYPGTNPYSGYNNYQAGIVLGILKNLYFNYCFDYRFYETLGEISFPSGANGITTEFFYFDDKIVTNRIGLNYHFNTNGFNWNTGLNAAESEIQVINNPYFADNYNSKYLGAGHRWSGGFTNRFTYKTFFAGLDVLYQAGERPYSLLGTVAGTANYVAPSNNNSFSLQNLYAGKQIRIPHLKYAEAFLNGRNILQNKSSDITDNRRFFGAGFKVGL